MDLEKEIQAKKCNLKIQKALAAKEELELTLLQREVENKKIKEHLALQDKVIEEAKQALESLIGK